MKIVISIPKRRLYLYSNGKLTEEYPVAVGKPNTESPQGDFYVTQKAAWGDGFGTRWMRLSVPWGIYGIRGTSASGSVGHAASQGSFRMLDRDAEQLYALVSVHTPVIIAGYVPFTMIRRPLHPGFVGQDVVELERLLRLALVCSGPLAGVYGAAVAMAVRRFQLVVGLDPSGIATATTVTKLLEYTKQARRNPRYRTE